jgi:hypothetical protein
MKSIPVDFVATVPLRIPIGSGGDTCPRRCLEVRYFNVKAMPVYASRLTFAVVRTSTWT